MIMRLAYLYDPLLKNGVQVLSSSVITNNGYHYVYTTTPITDDVIVNMGEKADER